MSALDAFTARVLAANARMEREEAEAQRPTPAAAPATDDFDGRLAEVKAQTVARAAARKTAKKSAERQAAAMDVARQAVALVESGADTRTRTTPDGWDEEYSPGVETAVQGLVRLGADGQAALAYLRDTVDWAYDVDQTVEMAVQIEEARAVQKLQATHAAQLQEAAAVQPKVAQRIQSLIAANDWINPESAKQELAHLTSQNPSAPSERLRLDDAIKRTREEIAVRQARQLDWLARFGTITEAMPSVLADFDTAEEAMLSALQVVAEVTNRTEDAELATKRLHAELDQAGVSVDSRDSSGRLVMVNPQGQVRYLSDDAAVAAEAAGWKLARDPEAIPVDLEGVEYDAFAPPAPTMEQQMADVAARINEKDKTVDAESLAAQVEWASQGPTAEEIAAGRQQAQEAHNQERLDTINSLGEQS